VKRNPRFLIIGSTVLIVIVFYSVFKPKQNVDYKQYIKGSSISLGMTKEQVISSWGSPDSINRFKDKRETKETWIYYKNRERPAYLNFQDGVLKKYNN